MVKYIVKRILISILILFGVSVIVYTLVRLMPSDYIDNKYAAQLNSNQMTQDDIDNFKALYGLYCPEATVEIEYDGVEGKFARDVKVLNYDFMVGASSTNQSYVSDFLVGRFKNGDLRMDLDKNKDTEALSYSVYKLSYHKEIKPVEEEDENGNTVTVDKEVYVEDREPIANGTFSATYNDGVITVNFAPRAGKTFSKESVYKETTFWQKLGTILGGYFTWLGNLIKGDLGESFKYSQPVGKVISDNMWISFAIAIVATILQFLIAIPLGISSATHQYTARDYIVTVFTMIGISLPTYFFAAIAIKFFAVDLGLFPINGLINASAYYPETFGGWLKKLGDMIHHLILPIFVSVILSLGGLMRYTRTNTLEVLNADYIRTARAKGLSEKTVIYKHAFRNTLIPLATLLAGILPGLFGGMMITEQVFAIDGIGRLAYNALRDGDVPFVMGYNMFLAVLTVIGTLLSDIMYSIVDPRVKLGR